MREAGGDALSSPRPPCPTRPWATVTLRTGSLSALPPLGHLWYKYQAKPRKAKGEGAFLNIGHLWHCLQNTWGLRGPLCSSPVICQVARGAGISLVVRKSCNSGDQYPFSPSACNMGTAGRYELRWASEHSCISQLSITMSNKMEECLFLTYDCHRLCD